MVHVRFNYLTSLIPSPSVRRRGRRGRRPLCSSPRHPFPPSLPLLPPDLIPLRGKNFLPPSRSPSFSFSLPLFLELSFNARSPICIPRKRISLGPFQVPLSFSPSLVSPTPNGSSSARGNSPPRIDHLPGRTLLGIISYVAMAHSRSDMRCVP